MFPNVRVEPKMVPSLHLLHPSCSSWIQYCETWKIPETLGINALVEMEFLVHKIIWWTSSWFFWMRMGSSSNQRRRFTTWSCTLCFWHWCNGWECIPNAPDHLLNQFPEFFLRTYFLQPEIPRNVCISCMSCRLYTIQLLFLRTKFPSSSFLCLVLNQFGLCLF
jgi:hypothetical protein